jgi:hypothetical protein
METKILCFDNGGDTLDRYTVLFLESIERGVIGGRGMSANPSHPLGVGQWFEIPVADDYSHLGVPIDFDALPQSCKTVVEADLADFEPDPIETLSNIDLEIMVEHYIDTALWSSTHTEHNGKHDEDIPMDQIENLGIAPETAATFAGDCYQFVLLCLDLLPEYLKENNIEQFAQDFWLTRCGHGAGFWDRGLGELGDKLSEQAKTMGNCDLYIGDDGLLYAI